MLVGHPSGAAKYIGLDVLIISFPDEEGVN